jgi:glycosyltransferase involved in cell wall biosynthesis
MPNPLRIALAHDWLVGMRGGERVLDSIARLIIAEHRPAALLAMFDDARPLSPAIDSIPKLIWPPGRTALAAGTLRRHLLPLYPRAVAHLSARLHQLHTREPIDLLISTSSAAIKGLRPPPGVPHLCYCHSPARYVWAPDSSYQRGPIGLALRAYAPLFKSWDRRTAKNVTRFLANSTAIRDRIRTAYNADSYIVFPPARTDFFMPHNTVLGGTGVPPVQNGPEQSQTPPRAIDRGSERSVFPPHNTNTSSIPTPRSNFWLFVAALEPYKRADLAIRAAASAKTPLKIVGKGRELSRLRVLAAATPNANVDFITNASDETLRDLYRSARLLIFPQIEDFGIVSIEAQACGTPVVARNQGGALDTVRNTITGILYEGESPDTIAAAAARCPNPDDPAVTRACRENALRFSEAAFANSLREHIAELTQKLPKKEAHGLKPVGS